MTEQQQQPEQDNSLKEKINQHTQRWVQKGGQLLGQMTGASNAFTGFAEVERADPFAAFRQQLPSLSKKVLSGRLQTLSKVVNHVVPSGALDQLADRVFEQMSLVAEQISQVQEVLSAANAHTLEELTQQSTEQADELAAYLTNRNRVIAAAQGAVTGATGLIGAIIDVPLVLLLILRTIYQTAQAYGMNLEGEEGRQRVLSILARLDLSLLVEKQTILLSMSTLQQFVAQGNLAELQSLVGSANSTDFFKKLAADLSESLNLPISATLLSRLVPVASGATNALYNARVVSLVAQAAQAEFRGDARPAPSHLDPQTQAQLEHFAEQVEADIALETADAPPPPPKPARKRTVRARKTDDGAIEPVSKTQH